MHFITISQMMGTDGEKIARKVASDLSYSFYGDQELFRAAEELDILADVRELDEKAPPCWKGFSAKSQRSISTVYSP